MGNPSKVGGALVVQRVCTAEEVGKRPSGSRLLSFFPLCRPVSLSLPSRRSLKKDFARREGGGGATERTRGIPEFHESPRRGRRAGDGDGGPREGMKGKSAYIESVRVSRDGRREWERERERGRVTRRESGEGETRLLRADRSSSTTASSTRANPLSRYCLLSWRVNCRVGLSLFSHSSTRIPHSWRGIRKGWIFFYRDKQKCV